MESGKALSGRSDDVSPEPIVCKYWRRDGIWIEKSGTSSKVQLRSNNERFDWNDEGPYPSVTLKCSSKTLKLVRTPLNVLLRHHFLNYLSFSLCSYNLGWMSCLISFERYQSSCEEHGTSEQFIGWFEPSHGKETSLKVQRLTARPILDWYEWRN